MLRANAGVIKSRRYTMCFSNLSVLILQHIRECTMQYTRPATCKSCCVFATLNTYTACFHTSYLYLLLFQEIIKKPDRITASTHASHQVIGQSALLLFDLLSCFLTYYLMKIAYNSRVRMRTQY